VACKRIRQPLVFDAYRSLLAFPVRRGATAFCRARRRSHVTIDHRAGTLSRDGSDDTLVIE